MRHIKTTQLQKVQSKFFEGLFENHVDESGVQTLTLHLTLVDPVILTANLEGSADSARGFCSFMNKNFAKEMQIVAADLLDFIEKSEKAAREM